MSTMKKRLLGVVIASALVGLAACTPINFGPLPTLPASPTQTLPAPIEDKLIGIFVSTDLPAGGRIDAVVTPDATPEYNFPGLAGFYLFSADLPGGAGTMTSASDSVLDVASSFANNQDTTTGATTNSMTVTGTLHVAGTDGTYDAFGSQIFQTPDGDIYVSPTDQGITV